MVTYADPFLRLQVSGSLFTAEEFSWSLAIDGVPPPAAVPQGVIDAVEAFHVATSTVNARLQTIKLNEIGTDGKYTSAGDTIYHDFTAPGVAGAATGGMAPPQVAIAVSLRSERARGPGAHGRFYIPSPPMSIQTDGNMAESVASATATAAATMLQDVATAVGGRIVIPSGGTTLTNRKTPVPSNPVPPAHVPVTGVRVGRVYDTQRRRRGDLPELYVTAAYAPPP